MRRVAECAAVLALASAALLVAGCNKGAAQESLEAADQALAAAKPELERYRPDDLAHLTADLQGARSELEKGHYTAALRTTQGLPARIQAALAAAATVKESFTASWKVLSDGLPGLVQAVSDRVEALAAAKSLPRGMTADTVASAPADLADLTRAWKEAEAAFRAGDVPKAVETAQEVKAKAEALAGRLGPTAAAAAMK